MEFLSAGSDRVCTQMRKQRGLGTIPWILKDPAFTSLTNQWQSINLDVADDAYLEPHPQRR
jgi:hypothetical protein